MTVLALFMLLAATFVVTPGAAQEDLHVPDDVVAGTEQQKAAASTYIIRMDGDPVVAYDGGVAGIPATKPGNGQKVNPNDRNVQRYITHLKQEHNRALRSVGVRTNAKFYDYFFSYNGFSATLTPAQAAALASVAGVVSVSPEEIRQVETDNSPDFLGLSGGGGLWGAGLDGEDVIIGILDTGIWPEHPSFADDVPGNEYGAPPAGWHGDCVSGEQWSQNDCNNKLIGATFFRLGAGQATAAVNPDEYLSTRDRDGHGTHTASTAGGNADVEASIFGIDRGVVSGIAPRARIAAYKVCWNDEGCFLSDIVQAIDTAVADGVDVINYSIGGGPSLLGADDIAFLFAADAGVFVATSAGNSGPAAATLGGPASVPWITSVGASTQDRTFQGSVELGDGAEFFGASITTGTDTLPIVDSAAAGSELCLPGELDPSVVSGNIVLCLRGDIARVEKSRAVDMAGGAGMVLYNENDAQSQVTDNHWVPSVHISNTDGGAVKSYIATELGLGNQPVATINGGALTPIPAPWMAAFSSRGPNPVAQDLIKPDVTAPGVNILAGNTPNPYLGSPGELFQSISGTSMSSPHVAGVAALVRQANPDWSPEAVKSALMTTAHQVVEKEDGATGADPFDMGAGHIVPNSAIDPGLVYDAGFLDYLAFLCPTGAVSQSDCDLLELLGFSLDASDLNLASIGIAELAGTQTVTRTVTNVGPAATYNVSVNAPTGVAVNVNPSSLPLAEGGSATFEVTFTTMPGATLDEWTFGSLTWSDGSHDVRSPLAVKPVGLAAPDDVVGTGTSGSTSFDVTFGFSGDFSTEVHGLIPATLTADTVVDDPANDINTALSTGVGVNFHIFAVPVTAEYMRFSLFDDYTDGADDLDLYLFGPDTAGFPNIAVSGSSTSAEEISIDDPAPGIYILAVHGWQTDGPDANYTLFSWLLGENDEGNMTAVGPASATLGGTDTVTVNWSGLDPNMKYLGSLTYHDVAAPTGYRDGMVDFTIVTVHTD